MNFLDRMIGYLFPGWGSRRAQSRYLVRQFTGAALDRLRSRGSYQNLGPIAENQAARATLLNVARELDRNNSFAHGAFNSLVDNIVGKGISLESRIGFKNGRLREDLNRAVEAEWTNWSKRCDVRGQLSFAEIQRIADRELWLAGEVLVVRSDSRDGRKIPLALEVVESERLVDRDEDLKNGNEVIQGIEFSAAGTIVAYYLYDRHPGDLKALAEAQRVPASRVLHLFRAMRPNQIRGLSRVASVARNFEALAQYMDHELTRARVGASFALMIKRGHFGAAPKWPSAGTGASTADENNNPVGHLEGGMIFSGGPSDSIEGTGPAVQTNAFEEFVTVNLRAIAVGLNMSYELLARDYTKTNFSSARQSDLQDRRHWVPQQQFLVDRLNDPVLNWFIGSAIVAGIRPFPAFSGLEPFSEAEELLDHTWITPPREYVDPTKEQEADERAVASGFTNLSKIAAKHGTDIHENIRLNAQIATEAKEAGLALKPFQGLEPAAAQAAEEEDNASPGEEDREQVAGSRSLQRQGRREQVGHRR